MQQGHSKVRNSVNRLPEADYYHWLMRVFLMKGNEAANWLRKPLNWPVPFPWTEPKAKSLKILEMAVGSPLFSPKFPRLDLVLQGAVWNGTYGTSDRRQISLNEIMTVLRVYANWQIWETAYGKKSKDAAMKKEITAKTFSCWLTTLK